MQLIASRFPALAAAAMSDAAPVAVEPAQSQKARPDGLARRVRAWFAGGDQLGLFILAAFGALLLAPEAILRVYYAAARLLDPTVTRPDLSAWPFVPRGLHVCIAIALLTFRMDRRLRLAALVAFVPALALLRGAVTPETIVPLGVFAVVAYAIIRLPLPRLLAASLMTLFVVAALLASVRWWEGTALVGFMGSFAVLIPVLWYSVYEHGRRVALRLHQFLMYLAGRLFSSPVMTYDDLFAPVQGAELTATRWAGMRAIYIALVASIAVNVLARLSEAAPREALTGLPLLALSYVEYVAYHCEIVVRFNAVIGVLRMFGVPVRSNFRYWLLARTPNDHWQRWNILAREWFVTFIFYPIMRLRRWLFAAVMAVMAAAYLLHIVPLAIIADITVPYAAAEAFYWTVNGLTIYLVIKLPKMYPGLIDRLGIPGSRTWVAVGIVLTSAFYATLHGIRTWSGSWGEMAAYLMRLVGQGSP
jgi:hypothetical protein